MLISLGDIRNGIFLPRHPELYAQRYLHHEGRTMLETLKRFSATHSDDTRGYLFGCVYRVIGEHIEGVGPNGERLYDKDEIHAMMKRLHHNKPVIGKDGQEERIGVSIAGIPQDEMSAYIQRVRAWALNFLGCYVPEPESDLGRAMAAEYGGR